MRNHRADIRHIEPWRRPRTAAGRELVAATVALIEEGEERERRRRAADRNRFLGAVVAIVADVAHLHLSSASGSGPRRLAVSRSKRHMSVPARYRTPLHVTVLPDILDGLAAAGLIEQRVGDRSKFARVFSDEFGEMRARMPTTITAGPRLVAALAAKGIGFHDFEIADDGELIVLRSARADYWSDAEAIDYDDTPRTRRWRRELRNVNDAIAAADITVLDAPHIDAGDRMMRRVFTQGSFERGGRLGGSAFWLRLKRSIRSTRLRIEGEPIAMVDFQSMFPRLCFAMAGLPQPAGDIYDIGVPGIGPAHRDAIKRLVSARLFDVGPRRSWPRRSPEDIAAGRTINPPMPVRVVLEAIEARHPVLAASFGHGLGHRLMFLESEIMMRVLTRGLRRGLVLLPLHDAVIVKSSQAAAAAELMRAAARDVVGVALPADVTRTAASSSIIHLTDHGGLGV